MNVRQPGKNTIQQQPPQQQPQPNYNPRNNAPQQYNLHTYSEHQDGPQKFSYGSPYVGGAGAAQPPRMPLVTGIPGPNQSLPGTPNASLGGMPQGPPPNTYVSHGPVDLSKQTPPHHQGQHHPLAPGSLGVNQQIMANTGHAGPMQGRQAQGNNQYFQRNPNIRPGNPQMRPPMHGGGASMNASHPPNAQAMPYPTQNPMMNQPVLFVLGDQYNNQTPMYSAYPSPANYYQQGNMVPPGSVQYQAQPRAATQAPYGYRQTVPYQYPMQTTQTVYFQQQPQQPQQQPQQQQQVQQQQPQQQAQQQPQQQIVSPAVTTPQSAPSQPRESGSSSSGRKTRSSALRIVDPDTHCDVLTGEKVAPSEVATPTTTQPPDLPTTPGSTPTSATPAGTPVTVQVPATSTATPVITPAPPATATIAASKVTSATVVPPKKDSPAPAAAAAVAVESTLATAPVAAPVSQEAKKITEPKAKAAESTPLATGKTETVVAPPVPVASVAAVPTPAASVVVPATAAVSATENGVAAATASVTATATSELPSTTSPTPVSTSTSPEAGEGRGTQKGGSKMRKSSNSRTGSSTPTTPPPPLVQAPAAAAATAVSAVASPVVEQPAITVAPPTQSKPETDSSAPAAKMEAVDVKETTPQPEVIVAAPTPVVAVEKKPVAEKTATVEVPVQSVITNGEQTTSPSSSVIESSVTTPTAVTAEEGSGGKSSSLRYTYKDDQWSPANPEGKKSYDRNFLLELMNNPASQKKPDGLPNLEVVRDKQSALAGVRRGVSVGDFTPGFMKPMPVKGMVKRPSQQGQRGDQSSGQRDGPPQRREIKLPSSSLVRVERVEDPNVWKPKHAAVKPKEEDADKSSLEEMSKAVRGILNKLTPSKFDKLLVRIQALNIDTEERLAEVIRLFFEKAVDEPIFSPTYAKMCHALSTKEVASSNNPSETTNFRKLLLTRCQREFEKDSAGLVEVENKRKEIEENEAEDKKKVLEEELEDLINKNRRRSLGNIRFIGELFKLRILSAKIMHQCILRLLSQPEDEESLECLCRLLSTIGKELESPAVQTGTARSASSSSRETMNSYFGTLDSIVQKRKVSNRIRFMIQDVVDLRKCQWKPRREDNKPQTIEQVHQDALREREQQERELNNPQFQGSMGGGGGGGQMRDNRGGGDRRGDRGDDRNRKQSRPNDDGWNTVSNNSRSNAKLDMSKLRIPKAASGDADQGISLGPGGRGMGSWGRGASGGMQSQSMIGGTSTGGGTGQDSRANRYQLLEDDHGSSHMPSEASKAPFSGRSSLGGPPAQGNRGGNQDYRNMPGSTKSAFFPPKDAGERPERVSFDSARQSNLGPGGRSRSQQSSRENSVTRPVRDAAQPPLLREPSKEMLLGKATSSDDEIERKANSLLGEYFINERIEDTVLDMKEWLHPATVSKFINQCLMHVLELKRKERRGTGTLLKEMIKRQLFTSKDILDGFLEVLQSAEDFLVDIPKLWEYLAEMVEPLFEDGAMTLGFLGPLSATLGSSLAPPFVAAVLKELVIAQGTAGAERIWGMSTTTLAIVLPEVDAKVFVSQHKGLEFVLNVDSTSRSTASGGKPNSGNASASTSVYIDFQHKLEKYLRGSQLSIEDVCQWIKDQCMVEDTPAFIRALTTAVTESAIDGYGTESKLNSDTLKKWTEVLRRYVENIADRELQLLFAVQTLVTQRQHPKGLIQGIFETLYDCNVVSEEGFTSWTTSDDPSEREGKAVALKSITSFLTWLNEAEAESDQEVDG